jgi:TPR repeat protein
MYSRGEGTPVNKAEAIKWYKKAADQGFGLAKEALKKIQ